MSKTKSTRAKPNRAVTSSSPDPYDPLDLKTLAESMAKVVLEQPVHALDLLGPFEGPGIYIIYYTGKFASYRQIGRQNQNGKWTQPIYVGEAARKGARKGGVLTEARGGKALFNRLQNHAERFVTQRISIWVGLLHATGTETRIHEPNDER